MHGQDEVSSSHTTELLRDFRKLQSDITSINASSLYLQASKGKKKSFFILFSLKKIAKERKAEHY